jgi:membrane protein
VAQRRTTQTRLARVWELTRLVAEEFRKRDLLTYASAIAFRGLVALVPLTLLGLGLLGAFGFQDVWRETIAPALEGRLTTPVYEGIDYSVERILSSGTAGLIAFAAVLLLWDLVWAVGAVMSALNRIHDVEERRSGRRRLLVRVGLAGVVGACLIGAALAVLAAPKLAEGALDVVIGIGRWVVGVTLLGLAVGLLFRYGPAERPQAKWASAGSVLVIASWIVASLLFRLYVKSVADFETAIGSLTVFLVLTAYVFTSAAIFIVGAQLDELLRKDAEEGESVGVFQLVRAAFGRSG